MGCTPPVPTEFQSTINGIAIGIFILTPIAKKCKAIPKLIRGFHYGNTFFVYFWTTQDNQFVKIGHCCGNLYRRGSRIQSGCPLPLVEYPIGVIVCENKPEMLKVERFTQRQFKAYRVQGEWFRFAHEISEYIEKFTNTEIGKVFVVEAREKLNKDYIKRKWERYQNNPELHEKEKKRQREYYHERHQNDPEYRERKRERDRERLKNDPEYREKRKRYFREYHQRKKAERLAENKELQLKLF